jgi:cell division protein FtsB
MAEQTQQQAQEPSIGLSQNLNIGALMGSLLDLQQLLRTVPQIIASAEAMKAENDKLKAENERLNAVIDGLASSEVKVEVAE